MSGVECKTKTSLCAEETASLVVAVPVKRDTLKGHYQVHKSANTSSQLPLWFETAHKVIPSADDLFGHPAETISSGSNILKLCSRHGTSVAAYTASITAGLTVLEPWWWSKVKSSERAGSPKGMPAWLSVHGSTSYDSILTYGLGMTARSSKAEASV